MLHALRTCSWVTTTAKMDTLLTSNSIFPVDPHETEGTGIPLEGVTWHQCCNTAALVRINTRKGDDVVSSPVKS